MTYLVFKYQTGKKLYLSVTGKWIKSTPTAQVFSQEAAKAKAAELGCFTRQHIFRD